MTQVNLLPSDVKERQRTRRLTAAVIMAVGAVVALLFFVFILQAARLSDASHELAAQQAVNADFQTKIGQLQEFAQLKAELAAREALTAAALDGEVAWSGVLRDVSMVIPDDVWLTGMVGSITPPSTPGAPASGSTSSPSGSSSSTTPTPATQPGATLIGTIQFQGMADDHPSVAQWLTRLEQVNGWANPWINNSTEVELQDGSNGVQWTGSIDLTVLATVRGGPR